MSGIINFTGEASDEYVDKIKSFGEKLKLKHVVLTTTSQGMKMGVSEDAEVTVMHYKGKKVAFNFASKGKLDDKAIKEIVKGTGKVLE